MHKIEQEQLFYYGIFATPEIAPYALTPGIPFLTAKSLEMYPLI